MSTQQKQLPFPKSPATFSHASGRGDRQLAVSGNTLDHTLILDDEAIIMTLDVDDNIIYSMNS